MHFSNLKQSIPILRQSKHIIGNKRHSDFYFYSLRKQFILIRILHSHSNSFQFLPITISDYSNYEFVNAPQEFTLFYERKTIIFIIKPTSISNLKPKLRTFKNPHCVKNIH